MSVKISSKITLNLTGLDQLRAALSAKQYVAVGFFGDHKNTRPEGGLTNVELALIQIFGSISNKIPARDCLLMPLQVKRKEILAFAASKKISDLLLRGEKKKALGLLGAFAENMIQEAFDTGGFGNWAPNAPATIKAKGSSKPLIDEGELRKAVWSRVMGL